MHLDGFDDGGELPGPDAIRKSLRMGRPCKMTNRILKKVSPSETPLTCKTSSRPIKDVI